MNKAQFIGALRSTFVGNGWREAPGGAAGALLHMYRAQPGDLFLSLVVESSSHYEETVTVSFYLAPHLAWGLVGPDSPRDAYLRVGELLEGVDQWWSGYTPTNVDAIAQAVALAQPAFLARLSGQVVADSLVSRIFAARIRAVVELVNASQEVREENRPREKNRPAPIWSEKAALALAQAGVEVDKRAVTFLAVNSWRLWRVQQLLAKTQQADSSEADPADPSRDDRSKS